MESLASPMFFFIYGMHHCFNIVTGPEGIPQAVLIRAAEPVSGLERMAQNRFGKAYARLEKKQLIQLTNGPGKLCAALAIHRDCNGMDLCGDELFLTDHDAEAFEVLSSRRIGIDYAEEAREFPWRMYIKDNRYVSVKGLRPPPPFSKHAGLPRIPPGQPRTQQAYYKTYSSTAPLLPDVVTRR
jgi:3-methyladenine DNA glycosylase